MMNLDKPQMGEYRKPYPKNPPQKLVTRSGGILIALEGNDGVGKSTLATKLQKQLSKKGRQVYKINFIHSKFIREILLEAKWNNFDPCTFSLLYSLALSQIYSTEIIPKLNSNSIVILDRYYLSIISRMLLKGVERQWLYDLISFLTEPDVTFLITNDPKVTLERKLKENQPLSYWECGCDNMSDDVYRFSENQQIFEKAFLEYQRNIQEIYFTEISGIKNSHILENYNIEETLNKMLILLKGYKI